MGEPQFKRAEILPNQVDTMVELFSEQSRVRAALVNSGAFSLADADEKVQSSAVHIDVGEHAANCVAGQAAFLTAVATGVRSFGSVYCTGVMDKEISLLIPVAGNSLKEAAFRLGARLDAPPAGLHRICIGDCSIDEYFVRAVWDGWTAGVVPRDDKRKCQNDYCPLAGIVAGALAIGQAFLRETGVHLAGQRSQLISLWEPGNDPLSVKGPSFEQIALPQSIWLIGLGNLGQAALWSILALPYSEPKKVDLVLQDDDVINRDNWGTSILVERGRYGPLKTRVAEEWALRREFNVRRVDRRFDEETRRRNDEPEIAIAGLDSMGPRKLLGKAGFDYIVDSGLGANAEDFQKFRINVFDQEYSPANHFHDVDDEVNERIERLMKLQTYQELAESLKDGGCGAAILAEKSVAVPFVSAIVGGMAVSQAIRIMSREVPYRSITASAVDLRTVNAV